jgi:hypothetical protein
VYSAGRAGDAHPSLSAAAVQFSVGALHAVSAVDGATQYAGAPDSFSSEKCRNKTPNGVGDLAKAGDFGF